MTDAYKSLIDSLPVITYEEFLKDEEDLCFEINDEKITDDLEEWIAENCENIYTEEEKQQTIDSAKRIVVSTKERYKIPKGYILEQVSSFLEDNFGYDSYELGGLEDAVGGEVFEECENKINQHIKGWYTSGYLRYVMDASKQVEEYFKEHEDE